MYGTVLMTNPLSNLIFAPIFTPLVYVFTNYTLLVISSIAITATCFIPMIDESYLVYVLFCVLFGLGESIF